MTRAQQNLERPVAFKTAAKKVARLRGHRGEAGGWIRNADGQAIAHGWESYGQHCLKVGLIAQDADHDGGNGRWFVPVLHLSDDLLRRAEITEGRP